MRQTQCVFRSLLAADTPAQRSLNDPVAARIVDEAIEAVAVLGWRRMTMSDVAKRGRIGRATLYRYFASKDELRDAIVLREMNRFMQESTAARTGAASVEDALTSSLAITLEFVRDNRMLNRLRETDREMLLETLFDDDLIATGREFSAQLWKTQLHGEAPVDESVMTHLRTVSEITVRLSLSLIANPRTTADFATPDASRAYVRRYILPLLGPPSAPLQG
ncbi:helix-turn-helix domain containing protein [Rhodococcus ruber]|uniref:Helix-turn-helix domain containing protein n=1 Tax=Rhodococcus ruber TaxID=1830 RepID=A0ABT4MAV5_9NOCA|nr:TetR/AcrR family transcriptional regulator [Rhodococcus ruber]MCZ4518098.1 helix-turn-helix domain containing protein [Rhodococcus ruber]